MSDPFYFRRRQPNSIVAICLIAAGIILFLANLGLFPVRRVWDLWPLVFCVVGFARLTAEKKPGSAVTGLAFITVGVVSTLATTGVFHLRIRGDSLPLALLFITLGIVGLANAQSGDPFIRFRSLFTNNPSDFNSGSESYLNDRTVMGNISRKVETQSFEGGRLVTTVGNIKLDLRRAQMQAGRKTAQLEVQVMMGQISLRIPETWRLCWTGDNVMSNFEDKTIPPNTGSNAPELHLTGSTFMGSIEVEN